MNPNDFFRDGALARIVSSKIKSAVVPDFSYRIMEVCGTHTMAISKTGLRSILPSEVDLVSGPGCPVCVTAQGEIDLFFQLINQGVSVATFGDLLRIPGSNGDTLQKARARGADVRVVYSPLDILKLASAEPSKQFVFLGVGFETTAPAVACIALEAEKRGLKNVSVLSLCKTMPKAIKLLLDDNDLDIGGFLCPGHVTAITGISLYEPIIARGKSAVVAGFEPIEMLGAILEIINQINSSSYHIVNDYKRVVPDGGNEIARNIIDKVFKATTVSWRGLGELEGSGLDFRDEYMAYDARKVFSLKESSVQDIKGCRCGGVLTGKIRPSDCPLFGKGCTPENPVGPCMVSSEGTCSAYYKYGNL